MLRRYVRRVEKSVDFSRDRKLDPRFSCHVSREKIGVSCCAMLCINNVSLMNTSSRHSMWFNRSSLREKGKKFNHPPFTKRAKNFITRSNHMEQTGLEVTL
jgi:hypothetical protein